jgi:hypothetical protein
LFVASREECNTVTDEDKSDRHRVPGRDWARGIPLVTILAFVFASGGLFVSQRLMAKSIEDLSNELKASTAAADARLRQLEDYRIAHEAVTTPLMQKFLEEHAARTSATRTNRTARPQPIPAATDSRP